MTMVSGTKTAPSSSSSSSSMYKHKKAPRARNIRGDSDISADHSDDASFAEQNENLESGLNFFDAFQEEQPPEPEGPPQQSQHTSTAPTSSSNNSVASSSNSEYILNEACTGALVGENVLDSPTSRPRRQRDILASSDSSKLPPSLAVPSSNNNHKNYPTDKFYNHSAQNKPTTSSSSYSSSLTDPLSLSMGLVTSGFAWIKEQREERRRRHLHQLAEEQAKKIEAAKQQQQPGELSTTTTTPQRSSLSDNPVFQNLTSVPSSHSSTGGGHASFDSATATGGDDHATISYSGDGYTVKISVPAVDDSNDHHDTAAATAASQDPDEVDTDWIPTVRIQEEENASSESPFLLNEAQRQCIAQQVLPKGIAYAKWKRLYSLARDGDSFEACLRLVQGHAQTLMVIRTSTNELLGGFADMTWESPAMAGAVYHGGPTSCLYSFVGTKNDTLSSTTTNGSDTPKDIHVYKWTGANRYIQLCDTQHKMLAFGGGGDDGAFGLSVAQDFQHGSSGPCATFDNAPLASSGNFSIVDVEIYCFLLGQF